MNTHRPSTLFTRALAVTGLVWMFPAPSQAAFVSLPSPTNETPGVMMDANTLGLSGTVLWTLDSPFVDNALPTPFASGILRSFVVDRDPTASILLDFYYQLVNRSTGPDPFGDAEFYRLKTTGGFDPSLTISVANTNALSGLIAGPGSGFIPGNYTTGATLKPATTADRDVGTLGSIGFDFPFQPPLPFIGDPRNIGGGEISSFLVIRTNATTFGIVDVRVSGAATSFPTALGASGRAVSVPEQGPGLIAFSFVILGLCLLKRVASQRGM